jgi:hypothetical protein
LTVRRPNRWMSKRGIWRPSSGAARGAQGREGSRRGEHVADRPDRADGRLPARLQVARLRSDRRFGGGVAACDFRLRLGGWTTGPCPFAQGVRRLGAGRPGASGVRHACHRDLSHFLASCSAAPQISICVTSPIAAPSPRSPIWWPDKSRWRSRPSVIWWRCTRQSAFGSWRVPATSARGSHWTCRRSARAATKSWEPVGTALLHQDARRYDRAPEHHHGRGVKSRRRQPRHSGPHSDALFAAES